MIASVTSSRSQSLEVSKEPELPVTRVFYFEVDWWEMKVDKIKFDDLLGRLLKAKPLPEKKVKAPKKRSPRPILDVPRRSER
jgi:hypothetical protein